VELTLRQEDIRWNQDENSEAVEDDRNNATAGGRRSQDEAGMTIRITIRLEEEDHRMRQRTRKMKDMVLMQMQIGFK